MQRSRVILLALSILCVPLTIAQAQQTTKVFRVGFLSATTPRSAPPFVAFAQRLRELGYVEGHNVAFAFRSAQGQVERLPDLAAELVQLPVDVLVAPGPEATLHAASRATSTIPIVTMAVNYDPAARGYIDSLARPGGNITGVFFMQLVLSGKRLSLLKEAMPQLTRVFALWDAYSADQLRATEAAAAQFQGLQLQSLELRNPPYDFEDAMRVAKRNHAQALVILSSPEFYRQRTRVAALTVKYRLPAIFLFRFFVQAGGLMSYGADLYEMYRHGATYVAKILQGARPVDLPVEQPTKFTLVINLKTAQRLGLTIPPLLLFQADEVIK
jgi:putative ABC transport system substrate-binding protein